MPVSLVCPVCSASFPVDAGLTDAAARAALVTALSLWPREVRPHVLRYIGLHAPKQRKLQMDKLARVLEELAGLLTSGEVTRSRETRPAPLEAWGAGLAEVLKSADAGTLDLPLQGHGLLAEIVWRHAGRAQAAAARATAPLHPSHRPAVLATPAPSVPETPAERPSDWTTTRRNGAQHVGALMAALKPQMPDRSTDPQPTQETPDV